MERLTNHLDSGIPKEFLRSYLSMVRSWAPVEPVIHVDDSDVVKPDGYKFESLGMVRDGSKSSSSKTVYTKGYHVTEACVMTTEGNPVSIFSKIHSSAETSYTSINDVTFSALERGAALFGKATYKRANAELTARATSDHYGLSCTAGIRVTFKECKDGASVQIPEWKGSGQS